MGYYTSIADVGAMMVKLLKENMCPEPILHPEHIGLASPADKGELSLSLFLYNIRESGEYRGNEVIVNNSGAIQYPPLSLNLYYLMTAHSSSDVTSRSYDESRILGRAMQVFFDNPILVKTSQFGGMTDSQEEVRIMLNNMPMEEMMKLWTFPNLPLKLSVGYMVGPVNIDSTRIKSKARVTRFDTTIRT